MYALIIMCLLSVLYYIHVLFMESELRQVYLMKMLCTWSRMLSEVSISARRYDPLLFSWAFNVKTETMTVLLRAFSIQA